MSLITLKDIGKIYVSAGNAAVGIRGVNLSFDKGEFVAVTGKSGSGKSTLLNVISGMDTYEEGEMLVENEPTSHFIQSDWEEYRQKYISFIFQDYNIIESFTVLQNVELALLHIENKRQRRERAMELLRRVGLEKHIHHKGSKLSGGQKQRTVIARALAKDSPIILADEPTGNLDSRTSKEIIELLHEVSSDKLVIVVTHNFEQVEECATRHIRVFDNAVESDHIISKPQAPFSAEKSEPGESREGNNSSLKKIKRQLSDGIVLGKARFRATPKLSVFLCILMILSAITITFVTSGSGGAVFDLFEKDYIFTHIDGRTTIIRRDGKIITDDELENLAQSLGAKAYMHYDFLLDTKQTLEMADGNSYSFVFSYDTFGRIEAGREPKADNEVFLRLPISLCDYYGRDSFDDLTLSGVFDMVDYKIVGIDYYYDNTIAPQIVFTEEGYIKASAIAYFSNSLDNLNIGVSIKDNFKESDAFLYTIKGNQICVSFDIDNGSFYISDPDYRKAVESLEMAKENIKGFDYTVETTLSGMFVNRYYSHDNDYYGFYDDNYVDYYNEHNTVSTNFDKYNNLMSVSDDLSNYIEYLDFLNPGRCSVLLSPDIIQDFMYEHYYSSSYTQASLFFENDKAAHDKVGELKALGYTAVVSDSENKSDGLEAIMNGIILLFSVFEWAISVIFISFFLSLCSARMMLATKGDIGILRSMGISTPVIKISVYIQTLIALIPAYFATAIIACAVFLIPATNQMFRFLYAWEYIVLAVAMLAINILLSKRYVKKMFGKSVKKTLKGEADHD